MAVTRRPGRGRSWLVLLALTVFLLSTLMSGCIVRPGQKSRASRSSSAERHKHRHCHKRGRHKKTKCHSHVHRHNRRGGGHH